MKRIDESVKKEIGPVRLKRSDLQTVAEIVGGGDPSKVEVRTDEFMELTVEKLILEDPRSKWITIRRVRGNDYKDTIAVTIWRGDRVVVECEDTDEYHAMAVRVLQLAESRRLRRGRYGANALFALFGMTGPLAAIPLQRRFKLDRVDSLLITLLPVVLLIGFFMWRLDKTYARFRREDEQPVKWRSVAWELTKMLVGAAVGTALTLYFKR